MVNSEEQADLGRAVFTGRCQVEEVDTEVLFSETPWTQLTQHVLIHLSKHEHYSISFTLLTYTVDEYLIKYNFS